MPKNKLYPSVYDIPMDGNLGDALAHLVDFTDEDSYTTLGRNYSIAVSRVIAVAWSPGRLARARRLLDEGSKPPPIVVERYRIKRTSRYWYVLTDGNHRTMAARMAGREKIKAHVVGECTLYPDRFVTKDAYLWKIDGDSMRMVSHELSLPVLQILKRLGVSDHEAYLNKEYKKLWKKKSV